MNAKIIIGCIAVVVIIGFGFVIARPPTTSTPDEPITTPSTTIETTTAEPEYIEEPPANDTPENSNERDHGTDLGMEYPIPDEPMTPPVLPPGVSAETFTIKGSGFSFDVTEIRVKKGDTVTINFESTDGFHDWVLDEFNAQTEKVQTGGITSVTFVADKTGTFEYYCSVGSHRANGMVGELIVE